MRWAAVVGEDARWERAATSPRPSRQAAAPFRNGQRDGLFDGYLDPRRPHAGAYDEMFVDEATVRLAYRRLHEQLAPSAPAELGARAEALDRALVDQGVTFSLSGQERPFPARYVSGYLHTKPDASIGETVSGENHAWIEAWTAAGGVSTRRTTSRSGRGTSGWPSGATARTCPR